MTQHSLLELARSGNPQAIASLMNQVLEPKGVVAKTQLDGNCLHIVFTSEHLLSQSAIASFVKNGLNSLGTKSFQTIKLYAQKIGQESPLWVDSFSLNNALSSQPSAPPSQPIAVPKPSTPPASLPTVHLPPEPAPVRVASSPRKRQKPSLKTKTHRFVARSIQSITERCNWILQLQNGYKIAIAVGAGAFLIGGTAALLSQTQAQSTSQASRPNDSPLAESSQSLVQPNQPPATPEQQVESYLVQMNQAQQAFYQANGRFAATLEELERSASILSHSTHYTYRLVLREQTQSVLTATSKQDGLRSYSGTVLTADSAHATPTSTIICKTNQPSSFPPILAQAAGQPIQCPTDSTQVAIGNGG
ncbi:MAG: type IV pilin-like G/H family protein [Leptolyngbyaceae cyanobacterium bins.302]|nr:type IV pilin-like G/H family protein [Leptolyngbyaceae cyanobacterium bins.302]